MSIYKNNNKGIMSLAVIFVVGFFGLGLALTITMVALVGLNKNYNTNSGNQTFYTAEAAAREGVYQLLTKNASYSGGNFQKINNATGTIFIATSTWNATVTATGLNNLSSRTIIYKINYFPAWQAFSKALYSGNSITLPGNDSMKTIDGDIYAENNVSNIENIDIHKNVATSGVEYIPFPTIDRNDLLSKTTFATDTSPGLETYLQNNYNSPNEIIFASGTYPSLLTLNNCDLVVKALIVEGDLTISNNSGITGLVYVIGTTTIDAGGSTKDRIIGSLISLGNIIIENGTGKNSRIYYDENIASAWKDLLGSSTPSGPSFSIIGWQEQ